MLASSAAAERGSPKRGAVAEDSEAEGAGGARGGSGGATPSARAARSEQGDGGTAEAAGASDDAIMQARAYSMAHTSLVPDDDESVVSGARTNRWPVGRDICGFVLLAAGISCLVSGAATSSLAVVILGALMIVPGLYQTGIYVRTVLSRAPSPHPDIYHLPDPRMGVV
jgi:hypothetical protein